MPDLLAPQLVLGAGPPDRMVTMVDVTEIEARYLAIEAVHRARQTMPRVSGATANRLEPIYDEGWFGIYFPDTWTWFMEHGTRPFTMRRLAGKTIPMWIDDPSGEERRANPKAKTRRTEDGRNQVLIFRRAAKIGQRKVVKRKNPVTGKEETSTTVASYPGAPGRINRRYSGQGFQGPHGAAQPGQIASGNVGVRWRHPGLRAMQFLNGAIASTVFHAGMLIETIYATDGAAWESLLTRKAV
jgi:hypothetical protein